MAIAAVKPPQVQQAVQRSFTAKEAVGKALLISTVALGVLSLIPPLRFAGSLGLRSVAFLSSCNSCSETWGRSSRVGKLLLISKISLVALGIVGIALASPLLMVASLVADTALQLKDLALAIEAEKWDQVTIHAAMILINTLVIAALVTGAWPFLVAASAIGIVLLGGMTIKMGMQGEDRLNALAHLALMGVGLAGLTMPIKTTFDLHDPSTLIQNTYGKDTYYILTTTPGESGLSPRDVRLKVERLLKEHVSHQQLTQELARRTLQNYIQQLDPSKTYFVESDLQKWLEPTEELLDAVIDGYAKEDFSTFNDIYAVMLKAIKRRRVLEQALSEEILPRELENPIVNDLKWFKTEADLKAHLRQMRILQQQTAEKVADPKHFIQRIHERRHRLENELLSYSSKEKQQIQLVHVLKATGSALDPHTKYLTLAEVDKYHTRMQGRYLDFVQFHAFLADARQP